MVSFEDHGKCVRSQKTRQRRQHVVQRICNEGNMLCTAYAYACTRTRAWTAGAARNHKHAHAHTHTRPSTTCRRTRGTGTGTSTGAARDVWVCEHGGACNVLERLLFDALRAEVLWLVLLRLARALVQVVLGATGGVRAHTPVVPVVVVVCVYARQQAPEHRHKLFVTYWWQWAVRLERVGTKRGGAGAGAGNVYTCHAGEAYGTVWRTVSHAPARCLLLSTLLSTPWALCSTTCGDPCALMPSRRRRSLQPKCSTALCHWHTFCSVNRHNIKITSGKQRRARFVYLG